MTHQPFPVYIGYDSREPAAFSVLVDSLIQHSTIPLQIVPLALRHVAGTLFTRPNEGSTEFSITRFLVPYMSNYHGWSLFLDCDMLFQADPAELIFEMIRQHDKAVLVCQHDYVPKACQPVVEECCWQCSAGIEENWKCVPGSPEACCRHRPTGDNHGEGVVKVGTKFLGEKQVAYPRKNWSSFMLFNNAKCKALSPSYVNSATGQQLHRFEWLKDEQIGSLPLEWNWLVGEYEDNEEAKNLHYTLGGPWFEPDCQMASTWLKQAARLVT